MLITPVSTFWQSCNVWPFHCSKDVFIDSVFRAQATGFTALAAQAVKVHNEMWMDMERQSRTYGSPLIHQVMSNRQTLNKTRTICNHVTISICSALLRTINHLKNKVICEHFTTFISQRTSPMIRHQLACEVNSSWRALVANSVLRLIISMTNALSLCGMRGPSEDPQ